jgi:hypothetical protein
MIVRGVFHYEERMQEDKHLFDTLYEALTYARYVCSDDE